jgi:hypothetical protein
MRPRQEFLMKRMYLLAAGITLGLSLCLACAPLLPYPTREGLLRIQAIQPNLNLNDLEVGRRLYAAHCASCHSLHLPSELTSQAWEKILPRMQNKANLGDIQGDYIMAYLTALSKDMAK